MKAKYSILIYNKKIIEIDNYVKTWLRSGLKLFIFCTKEEKEYLASEYSDFLSSKLILIFELIDTSRSFVFVDGNADKDDFMFLSRKYPLFNSAQYAVEHCIDDGNIIVEASAGTGKTTVMIDRIMFLLHTVPGLTLSDITMITFTNEATNQMNERLQKALMNRYRVTSNIKYIKWLEDQSDMTISTIDSFSFDILKKYGVSKGLSQSMSIRALNYERKELIKDVTDRVLFPDKNISDQLGTTFYSATNLVDSFWGKMTELGVDVDKVVDLDWGRCDYKSSGNFQDNLKKIISDIQEEYRELKRVNDATSLGDIKKDLRDALFSGENHNFASKIEFKYLFVDEFQDSDNTQIESISELTNVLGLHLFAVGDTKQSIYRFRGAADSAFIKLKSMLKGRPLHQFALINNYRTSKYILDRMNFYFDCWAKEGLLSYKDHVYACNNSEGSFEFFQSIKKGLDEEKFAEEARLSLQQLSERYDPQKSPESQKVVILTRSNRQLNRIAEVCDAFKIPAIVRREGSFYSSEAVRDFYALINSFLYEQEPIHKFNYLATPFCTAEGKIDIRKLESLQGDRQAVLTEINNNILDPLWTHYSKEMRIKSVVAVIKNILESPDVISRFITRKTEYRIANGWDTESTNSITMTEAIQYRANLEKLLLILQQHFHKEGATLNSISQFLKYNIATNRDENEAEIETPDDYRCLYCMTVHKAKGLEFDTVILPFMELPLYYNSSTEILIDKNKARIGWNVVTSNGTMRNNNYNSIRREENVNATEEETRILYVAMTRTINAFKCFLSNTKSDNCWAGLIWKAGIENE